MIFFIFCWTYHLLYKKRTKEKNKHNFWAYRMKEKKLNLTDSRFGECRPAIKHDRRGRNRRNNIFDHVDNHVSHIILNQSWT